MMVLLLICKLGVLGWISNTLPTVTSFDLHVFSASCERKQQQDTQACDSSPKLLSFHLPPDDLAVACIILCMCFCLLSHFSNFKLLEIGNPHNSGIAGFLCLILAPGDA